MAERFRLFEIDQPAVLDFKMASLRAQGATATCRHHPVGADLRGDWASVLLAAGFSLTVPTVWLVEGLMPYLDAATALRVFGTMHELSAPGSAMAVECVPDLSGSVLNTVLATTESTIGLNIPALIDIMQPRVDPEEVLADLGWRVQVLTARDAAVEFGRQVRDAALLHYDVYVFAEPTQRK